MSKQRIINTKFWRDDYVEKLDPIEKLLFLYFLTNPDTEICGVYELPLKIIAIDTGIEREMVKKILGRFRKEKKIFYIEGWIYIVNFTKNQTKNPSVSQGIERCFKEIPDSVRQAVDRLLHYGTPNLTKPNLTKPNLYSSVNAADPKLNDLIKLFESINPSYEKLFSNKTQRQALERLTKKFGVEKISATIEMLPKINSTKYAPTITTPLQLEDKLGQLKAFIEKEKSGGKVAITF